jgi:polysaccharide deacetylase family protein (PEP-CTERM system associated)
MTESPERRSILTLDVEEWFHAHNYREHVKSASWDERPRRADQGVERLLGLCEELGARATWFVLGWTANKDPGLVREIAAAGHEIGCHTYGHPVAFELDPEGFRDDTRRGRDAIAEATGQVPRAFRAASFTILPRNYWALEILREEGFRIDSSLFPVAHPRYGNPRGPREPFRLGSGTDDDLLVLPMTTLRLPGRNFPFSGGGYFRLFPAPLVRACTSWVQRIQGEPVVWYFHPWELDEFKPTIDLGPLQNLRSQGGKHDLHAKLAKALRGQQLVTLGEYAASVREKAAVYSTVDEIPVANRWSVA